MTYIDGFLAAVPTARKADYIAHSKEAWERIFAPAGALHCTEAWGDDVPEGKLTSFPMAVKCQPDETVVFAWIEWPDKATRDACMAAMEAGDGIEGMNEMPMDGKRVVFGGFEPILTLNRTPG